jgi:transposase
MRVSKQRIVEAVAASGTVLTELFGVGPVVAAMLIGYTGDVTRFANRGAHIALRAATAHSKVPSAFGSAAAERCSVCALATV